MSKIKPCSYCGNDHLHECESGGDHWIRCSHCEMLGPEADGGCFAIAGWNALPRKSDVEAAAARADAAEARAEKHLRDLTALREYLVLNAQEEPDVDECFRNSEAMHPDDWRRVGDFLERRDASRLGAVEAERNRLASLAASQRDRLVELERELEAAKLAACDGTPCSIVTEDHLIFSTRQALARTAPAANPETGAPVSLGWRIRWLCDRVAELEAASKARGEKLVIAFQGLARECYRDGLRAAGTDGSVVGRRMNEALASLGFDEVVSAAPVEWREGVPSVADVRAHPEGTWQWQGCYGDKWEPEDTTDHVTIQMIRVIKDKVNVWDRDLESWRVWTPIDGVVIRARPCVDGTPVPWPVHGAEGVADAS